MVIVRDSNSKKKKDSLRQKRSSERQYVFDKVRTINLDICFNKPTKTFQAFGFDSTQEEVYRETTHHLVTNVLQGYNATVFAYGATGRTLG